MDVLETDEGTDVMLALEQIGVRVERAFERLEQVAAIADRTAEIVEHIADRMETQVATMERLGRVLDVLDDPPPWARALMDRKARKAAD